MAESMVWVSSDAERESVDSLMRHRWRTRRLWMVCGRFIGCSLADCGG